MATVNAGFSEVEELSISVTATGALSAAEMYGYIGKSGATIGGAGLAIALDIDDIQAGFEEDGLRGGVIEGSGTFGTVAFGGIGGAATVAGLGVSGPVGWAIGVAAIVGWGFVGELTMETGTRGLFSAFDRLAGLFHSDITTYDPGDPAVQHAGYERNTIDVLSDEMFAGRYGLDTFGQIGVPGYAQKAAEAATQAANNAGMHGFAAVEAAADAAATGGWSANGGSQSMAGGIDQAVNDGMAAAAAQAAAQAEHDAAQAANDAGLAAESENGADKPIMIDLDGDGVEILTADEALVLFDVDDDGFLERTSWVGADDAFLVLDEGEDDDVTTAKEIIFSRWLDEEVDLSALYSDPIIAAMDTDQNGTVSLTEAVTHLIAVEDPTGAAFATADEDGDGVLSHAEAQDWVDRNDDGLRTDLEVVAALFDSNRDGLLDSQDDAWSRLKLWNDANSDGVVDSGEMLTLVGEDVTAIGLEDLTADDHSVLLGDGTIVHGLLDIFKGDGTTALGADVSLAAASYGFYTETDANGSETYHLEGGGSEFYYQLDEQTLEHSVINSVDDVAAEVSDVARGATGNALDNILDSEAANTDTRLDGAGGNDTLTGGAYDDLLIGGEGDDILIGSTLTELPDPDVATDGTELPPAYDRDMLLGGAGNDTLRGGLGEDILQGGEGADTLEGGAGGDILFVDTDDVTQGSIDGGDGYDAAIFESDDNTTFVLSDHNIEYAQLGDGDDVIRVYDLGEDVFIDPTDGKIYEKSTITDSFEYDATMSVTATLSGYYYVNHGYFSYQQVHYPGTSNEWTGTVIAEARSHVRNVTSTTAVTSAQQEYTTDVLDEVTEGPLANLSDWLLAESPAVVGEDGSSAEPGEQDESAPAHFKSFQLFAGAGDDEVHGAAGRDVIAGQAGDDSLNGDLGNDVYLFGRGDGFDTIHDIGWTVDVEEVEKTVTRTVAVDSVSSSYSTHISNVYHERPEWQGGSYYQELHTYNHSYSLSTNYTYETVTYTENVITRVEAHGGFDTLYLDTGINFEDLQFSASGDDLVIAIAPLEGEDVATEGVTITGGLTENAAIEVLTLSSGMSFDLRSILDGLGTDADETLDGTEENDVLRGEAGNDALSGGEGIDLLVGGIGNDMLAGGAGSDTYYYSLGDGHDTIDDAVVEGDTDFLHFGPGIGAGDLTFGRVGDDLTISVSREDDTGATVVDGSVTITNYFVGGWLQWLVLNDGSSISVSQVIAEVMATDGDDDITWTETSLQISSGDGDDTIVSGSFNDYLIGGAGDDTLIGGGGADVLLGGDGDDVISAGNPEPGLDFSGSQIALLDYGFTVSATDAATQDRNPRQVVDVDGDGFDDLVTFADQGVMAALSNGDGTFQDTVQVFAGYTPDAGGWYSQDDYPRQLADVNGDGLADIVGFADIGLLVSLAMDDGTFGSPYYGLYDLATQAGGWTTQDQYPRLLADVNGDGLADIVAFSDDEVYVSLSIGSSFAAKTRHVLSSGFGTSSGGWVSQDQYPRQLADVNGDGRADIVGFHTDGTYVALSQADGTFDDLGLVLAGYGTSASAGGWLTQNDMPRQLADMNGDGMADIVGFHDDGMHVALANGDGTFTKLDLVQSAFGASVSAGSWITQDDLPRLLGDINGDGIDDIVGFGETEYHVQLTPDEGPSNLLHGGAGNDTLVGGEGHDTYLYDFGDGTDVVVDESVAGYTNSLNFGFGIEMDDVTLNRSNDDLLVWLSDTALDEVGPDGTTTPTPTPTHSLAIVVRDYFLDGGVDKITFQDGSEIIDDEIDSVLEELNPVMQDLLGTEYASFLA
jgi:Ca2+-binding RTX toxin-like protein